MVIPDGGVDADEDLELDDIYLIESKDDDDDDKWQWVMMKKVCINVGLR